MLNTVFPSPLGVSIFLILALSNSTGLRKGFPSPLGVSIFLIVVGEIAVSAGVGTVSVPSRGIYLLNGSKMYNIYEVTKSFRPLSGYLSS